ncbi:MAG TPA: hypothetical protein VNX40_11470 [Mucilaginibacter sp.]|nr:hypothetical protein [Mucilaginibacter sp.]
MKTAQHIIKKCLAITLLAVYLFMVSAYVVYHPKHIILSPAISAANALSSLHGDNTSNTSFTQLHGALKSIIENNRKAITLLFNATALGFTLIFLSFSLPVLVRKLSFFNKPVYLYSYYYLALCTLRI